MMSLKNLIIIILVVLTLGAGGTAAFYYNQYSALKANPQKLAQEENTALIARVKQLIVLPEGEDPTIATVADPEKLKDQPFFARAKAGFKVLIYSKARKAILYDPFAHLIVEVAPVNIGTPQQSTSPQPTPQVPQESQE